MNKPKSILLRIVALAAFAAALSFQSPAPVRAADEERVTTELVNEIAAQHDKIVANQQLIDQKLAAIAENLRLARIYVARGGGKK